MVILSKTTIEKMYPFTCCVGVVRGGIWSYDVKQR